MSRQLFVGNIDYGADDDALRRVFEAAGVPVLSTRIMRQDGKSRGFGFVVIEQSMTVVQAIEQVDGQELNGRPIRVQEAKPVARVAK